MFLSQIDIFCGCNVHITLFAVFPECPVGSVHQVSPYEQDKTSTAHFGQKRLPVASCLPIRIQGAAAAYSPEDNAPQSRECHAELDAFSS